MAVYYFTIFTLTGLGYALAVLTERSIENTKKNKIVIFYLSVVFLSLTFIASFRYAIGFDYFSYRNVYEMLSEWSFEQILHTYWDEPLFFILCKIFSVLRFSFPVFLLCINAFLFFAAMWFIYHESKLPWISVYLFITLQFLAYDMNLIRQAVAVCFFLFSYPYLKKRKIIPYAAIILFGALLHNSLLIMLPFYFLLPRKNSRKFTAVLLGLTILCYFLFDPLFIFLQPFLPERYVRYFGTYFWNSNSFLYVVPSAVYMFLILFFRNRIVSPIQQAVFLNSAFYHFLLSLFITKHYILERFSIYPFTISLIAIPEIIASYPHGKNASAKENAAYYRVLFIFLLFGAAYFFFAASKGFHNVYPYVSWLDKSHSTPQ